MLKKVKYTRLGPMAQMIQIPSSEDIQKDVHDVIVNEVLEGYLDHDQNAFSTYLYLEGAYLGCLRFAQDYDYGPVIRLKMYSEQSDSTNAFTQEVEKAKGLHLAPFFQCGKIDTEKLTAFLDVWLDQFTTSLDNRYTRAAYYGKIPATFSPDSTGFELLAHRFIEVSTDACHEKLGSMMEIRDAESGFLEYDSVFHRGGGGAIWKLIYPGRLNKPPVFRRIFRWNEYPADCIGLDAVKTAELLRGILEGELPYTYCNEFPTPLRR